MPLSPSVRARPCGLLSGQRCRGSGDHDVIIGGGGCRHCRCRHCPLPSLPSLQLPSPVSSLSSLLQSSLSPPMSLSSNSILAVAQSSHKLEATALPFPGCRLGGTLGQGGGAETALAAAASGRLAPPSPVRCDEVQKLHKEWFLMDHQLNNYGRS